MNDKSALDIEEIIVPETPRWNAAMWYEIGQRVRFHGVVWQCREVMDQYGRQMCINEQPGMSRHWFQVTV